MREKDLSKKRNRNRERNTKGDTMGTGKFPLVALVIVIVTLMVKAINYLCFPLWSVHFWLFIYI